MAEPTVVIQSQDTAFSRVGNTYQTVEHAVNAAPNILVPNFEIFGDPAYIPGGVTLYDIQGNDPDAYIGAATLYDLTLINPFDTSYETNTNALYSRSFAIARAAAQSGPVNVRGGTAQQAFELAELDTLYSINRFKEVWQNQVRVWELVNASIQVANAARDSIERERLAAQQQQATTEHSRMMANVAAAEVNNAYNNTLVQRFAASANYSQSTMRTEESFSGMGTQSGITTGFGMSSWR